MLTDGFMPMDDTVLAANDDLLCPSVCVASSLYSIRILHP